MRNWKERWDPDAEFVFNKRLKLGLDAENPWVMPGDPVDKLALGIRRLHRWWDAGMISLSKTPVEAPKAKVLRVTAKCFEVRVPGKKTLRFDSKDEAMQALEVIEEQSTTEDTPHIEKLNKRTWALHTKEGVEKIDGMGKAIERLHEVVRG